MREWSGNAFLRRKRYVRGLVVTMALFGLAGPAPAQDEPPDAPGHGPTLVVPGKPEISTLHIDGSQITVETSERWTLISGSNPAGVTEADLMAWVARHDAEMAAGPAVVLDSGRDSGLNLVFNLAGSVPPEAVPAIQQAQQYVESLFGNAVTVTINLSYQDLGGGGVIGAAASAYVNNVSYTISRASLIAGMDSTDVIQEWLPIGSTVPVRYNGHSPTVSYEGLIQWTRANYRAAIGHVAGTDANVIFNTRFPFDYDPSNGITSGHMSFIDVLLHEVGHVLGFVSAADWTSTDAMTSLDLFRFQRTGSQYNPSTYPEFQTFPRLVDFNRPDDDHISDIITHEYRMSDGDPYQASHFRQQPNRIGLMAPTFAYGETYYPFYFTMADVNMFDAIGWDYPPCVMPQFLEQPVSQTVCVGGQAEFTVQVDIAAPAFQWRDGVTPLVDDGVHIFGAQTATLHLVNVTTAHATSAINCYVTNTLDGCSRHSQFASLIVEDLDPVSITSHPADLNVPYGHHAVFSVAATGGTPLSYRWRKDGVPLQNGGNVYFADTDRLVIFWATPAWNGLYDVVVSNLCDDEISNAARLTVSPQIVLGDLNCDGVVNFEDINPFVMALSNPALYEATYPGCPFENRDINGDGKFDFRDINPFVQLLAGP